MSLCVRIKRKTETIFLELFPSDTLLSVKEKIAAILGQSIHSLGLFANLEKQLENDKTVAEYGIENEQILALVYRQADESFESVDFEGMKGIPNGGKEASS